MIDELRLDMFQGFGQPQTIPLRPFTLIYGPNAAGKSSILRALRLLNQSVNARGSESSFLFDGDEISMASFQNTIYQHEVSEPDGALVPMDLGCTLRVEPTPSSRSNDWHFWFSGVTIDWSLVAPGIVGSVELQFHTREPRLEDVLFSFDVVPRGNRPVVATVFSGEETLKEVEMGRARPTSGAVANMSVESQRSYEAEQEYNSNFDLSWEEFILETAFHMSSILPRPYPENHPANRRARTEGSSGRFLGSSRQGRFLAELLSMPMQLLNRQARATAYVGPLREITRRLDFVQAKETFVDPLDSLEEPSNQEAHDSLLSAWLERLTDGRYSFQRVEFKSEEVGIFGALQADFIYDNFTDTQVSFQDVGVGLSQVMPILRSLMTIKSGSGKTKTLLIEQPELHLHPKMQMHLADLLIDAATRRGVQILAETHSEAFLLRVQKRLREGTLDVSDVQVLYVDNDGGNNFVRQIPLERGLDFEAELPISFANLRLAEYL